jgi:hypothetical protein
MGARRTRRMGRYVFLTSEYRMVTQNAGKFLEMEIEGT